MIIGNIARAMRDLIQALILLLVLIVLLKLFSLPSWDDWSDWIDYRIAVANIETKEAPPLTREIERKIWLSTSFWIKDKDKAIALLCRLAEKGKEEAELLLLIYDMGQSDCPSPPEVQD